MTILYKTIGKNYIRLTTQDILLAHSSVQQLYSVDFQANQTKID